MTLQESLEKAAHLSLLWEQKAQEFILLGIELQEALSMVSALLAIERAKQEE